MINPNEKIESGYTVSFGITNVKNPPSFRPTGSLSYTVYNMEGVVVEKQNDLNTITNRIQGEMNAAVNGVVPSNFE